MSSDSGKRLRYGTAFLIILALLIAVSVLNICTGSVAIRFRDILDILFKGDMTDPTAYDIIWKIRFPRLLLALVLGGALSLSGYLLQTFFRNPIAGPFVLGISSGAKMFLAVITVLMSGLMSSVPVSVTVIAAFAGSMLSMLLVILFAGKIRSMSVLLVIGIMISYICTAVTDFVINFASEADIVDLTHWAHGSFSAASWKDVAVSLAVVVPSSVIIFMLSKPISAYLLGEGYARSLGVDTGAFRLVLILMSSLLSAAVIAFAGPISFVGIAVPHIARMLMRTTKPIVMIPAVFLTGAVFVLAADLIARTAFAPVELSISTVTSIIGAPVVIWLMLKRRSGKNE